MPPLAMGSLRGASTATASHAREPRTSQGKYNAARRVSGRSSRSCNYATDAVGFKSGGPALRAPREQFNFFNAIVAIAVIVSLLGVVNTLAMSVIERTREIGVLRALGSSRWLVRQAMLDESLMITMAGAVAGVLIGLLIGFVWVSSMAGLMPGIAFHLPIGTMVGVAIASVIAGVIAAALPARRAAKLRVIQALIYE